jgi:hypothetical protein
VAANPVVTRTDPDVLPAIAAQEARGAAALRTLVLDTGGSGTTGDSDTTRGSGGATNGNSVRWSLLATRGPVAGLDSAAAAQTRLRASDPDGALVVPVIGALLSDSGRDVRPELTELGVGSVLALGPVADATVLALDAAPGLARVATSSRHDLLWRVQLDGAGPSRPSRVRLTDAAGQPVAALPSRGPLVDAEVAAGPPGRLLVLAERHDRGWRASLDGRALAPTTVHGWAQGFVVPTAGGRLVVRYDEGLIGRTEGIRLIAGCLAVLLAIPLPRLRRRVAVPPARPSRPVPRGVVTPPSDVAPSPQVFDSDHPEAGPDDDPADPWPVTEVPRRRLFGRGSGERFARSGRGTGR